MEASDTWAKPLQSDIERLLYTLFFAPLLKELAEKKDNSIFNKSALIRAIERGSISYHNGAFVGERNASISKELKAMGATFNSLRKAWVIPLHNLPLNVRSAVGKATQKAAERERSLSAMLTEMQALYRKIIPKFSFQNQSRETLQQMAAEVRRTIPAELALQPKLDAAQQEKLNDDYTSNVRLSIVDFLDDEVERFRKNLLPNIKAGISRIEVQRHIAHRLGVSRERAKFIARQETALFTSKIKEIQYKSSGIEKFRWKAIGGSRGDGRTRESHMHAHGHEFYFDKDRNDKGISKPVNGKGVTVNPGEDFGCRCQAVPIIESI